ncbi:class I SAM-dependent methyltransferase [Arthrobacter sp. CAN_A6]|uniref:class I SAM-dependent methyltransferase n=1 Tax=Arthrobacter sp. CAN_A6 TaxID=2787721 RepID=UPI002FEF5F27
MDGLIIDAGCGPGQWTNFLKDCGASVEGIDLVQEFVHQAKERFPDVAFRVGSLDALGAADESISGILAWYSIIHLAPAETASAFKEFARCVRPGGGLLLGFFDGPAIEMFPHVVAPAYLWPVDELSLVIAAAGFEVLESHRRVDGAHRPHAAIVARRIG